MSAELHLRPAAPDDATMLAALGIQVWLHTYATDGITATIADFALSSFTPGRIAALVARADTQVVVGEIDGRLVGYATIAWGGTCPVATAATAELATLYVQAPFVGRGVGTTLLASAESAARERTGEPLWLTAYAGNDRARAFYARRGYRTIGTTTFRLGDTGHDNVVLLGPG